MKRVETVARGGLSSLIYCCALESGRLLIHGSIDDPAGDRKRDYRAGTRGALD